MNNNQTSVDDTADDNTKVTTPSDTSDDTTSNDVTTTDTPSADEPIVDEPVVDDGRDYFSEQTITNPIVVRNSFESVNSAITIESGDTFSITDSAGASITLNHTDITNEDSSSVFLNIVNSLNTTLTLKNQVAEGDIVLDNLSSLSFILNGGSCYMGIINGGNAAQSVSVTLDDASQLVLAGNSYISELKNTDTANTNIYSNGYKLYVAGEEIAVNTSEAPELPKPAEKEEEVQELVPVDVPNSADTSASTDYTPFIVGGIAVLVIIIAIIVFILHNKKQKSSPTDGMNIDADISSNGRPDFSQFDDGPVQTPTAPPETSATPETQSAPTPAAPTQPTPPPSDSHEPYVGQM